MPHTQDALAVVLEATDADGDELSYSVELVAPGEEAAAVSLNGNVLVIDPVDGFIGSFQVVVAASDGIEAAGETFEVTVLNTAPVLAPIGPWPTLRTRSPSCSKRPTPTATS